MPPPDTTEPPTPVPPWESAGPPADDPVAADSSRPAGKLSALQARIRRLRGWLWTRILWSSTVAVVLLAAWGARDLDHRWRGARHDGSAWEDLETWDDRPEETVTDPVLTDLWLRTLRSRELLLPVDGVQPEDLRDDFGDPRGAGRRHQGLDIMAPKGTAVRAVDHGVVVALGDGGLGGVHVFQSDRTGTFVYYYAHLDRRVWGLDEGDEVERGDVLGYVGTTGNAPRDAPHLHFGIYQGRHGARRTAINPYRVFRPQVP